MASIGNWFYRGVPAKGSEEVIASYAANYLRANERPIGGKLYLTNQRIVFAPQLIDAWFGADAIVRTHINIQDIESMDPDPDDPFAGGARERLRVIEIDGRETVFIVHKHDRAMRRIDATVAECIAERS